MKNSTSIFLIILITTFKLQAQTAQDTIDINRVALAYIESQHNPNPKLMEDVLHPRLVKRSVFKNKTTKKDYVSEFFTENMIILAESYNIKGDKFPKNPRKDVKLLDISTKIASVKLIADTWIDYMHIVKTNGKWKVINILWQYNDINEHQ
ncbi:nuclear transport factor 2 family protein [Pedobacter frigoris]|uniref:Nuclear transport factor 2 family protein n=1 Tax=Pedobacter frigoris TaxID=2571272 RepID=A0A4U1CS91_9SPHI|nr:nuclear transport factor 2 family protein [Pedobacter frigoris]TKC08588.1 nuclear transport factor 2 family protein [Pedobacter frigoris]